MRLLRLYLVPYLFTVCLQYLPSDSNVKTVNGQSFSIFAPQGEFTAQLLRCPCSCELTIQYTYHCITDDIEEIYDNLTQVHTMLCCVCIILLDT